MMTDKTDQELATEWPTCDYAQGDEYITMRHASGEYDVDLQWDRGLLYWRGNVTYTPKDTRSSHVAAMTFHGSYVYNPPIASARGWADGKVQEHMEARAMEEKGIPEGWTRFQVGDDISYRHEGKHQVVDVEVEEDDVCMEVDPRFIGDGARANVPLNVIADILRHHGWTVVPPEPTTKTKG